MAKVPGLILPAEPEWARTNWQSYCVRLPEGVDQREVMQGMLDEGIATRKGIMCAHREPAYGGLGTWRCGQRTCQPGDTCPNLTQSERAQDEAIILPLFGQMTDDQQVRVASVLRDVCSSRIAD
jgi:dTDP-4-amino-4,6-dideoxygalactose transaminase